MQYGHNDQPVIDIAGGIASVFCCMKLAAASRFICFTSREDIIEKVIF